MVSPWPCRTGFYSALTRTFLTTDDPPPPCTSHGPHFHPHPHDAICPNHIHYNPVLQVDCSIPRVAAVDRIRRSILRREHELREHGLQPVVLPLPRFVRMRRPGTA